MTDVFAAHVIQKILSGGHVNGHADNLSEPYKSIVEAIKAAPSTLEQIQAFQAAIAGRPDEAAINDEVSKADPQADLDTMAPKPPKPRYVVRTAADALKPQPPIDWIIEKLFSVGSLSVVVGAPGTKKTYSMLSAAVCVALGKPWVNMKTKQITALVVDEESGERRLGRRLGEVLRGEGGNDRTPVNYVSLAQFNLTDIADQIIFQDLIEKTGAGMVVIDALADIMLGADENSVKDVQPVFMALRKIADDTGAAIVMIHHSNKMGEYRGSSAISGAIDLMLGVESKDGSPNIDFETKKARDIASFKFSAVAHFIESYYDVNTLEYIESSFHMTESLANVQSGPKPVGKPENYVIRYLEDHGNEALTTDIVANADTCTPSSARQAIYRLVDKKLIHRSDPGGQQDKATFKLGPKPKQKMTPEEDVEDV